MAQHFFPHGSPNVSFPDAHMPEYSQPDSYPAFPLLLGSGHIPDRLLYWNNDRNPQAGIAPIPRPTFPVLQQQQQQLQHQGQSQPQLPPQLQQQQPIPTEPRKHKRTRSGCLTCRSRRVKCDEGRPVCEKCKKGNRPCEYPQPNARIASRTKSRRQLSHESISSDEENVDQGGSLGVIPDEDETAELPRSLPKMSSDSVSAQKMGAHSPSNNNFRPRNSSETSSASKTKSSSPASDWVSSSQSSTSSSAFRQHRSRFVQQPARNLPDIFKHKRLKDDVQFFLNYHQKRINHHHYSMNYTTDLFFRGTLIDLALEYEPLLYAVVGFAAYHYTLENPQGKLNDFLKFYNQSITLLRKSLASGEKHSEATLATILQLSTFEESIGDFMNLVDHHQAADQLVHELLTPQSITETKNHRYLFVWHCRFDLVACILASNEAILEREWYMSLEKHDAALAAQNPDDHILQLSAIISRVRILALEYASLFARLSHKVISLEQFHEGYDILSRVIEDIYQSLRAYDNCEEITMPRPAVPLQGPEDILDTDMVCRFYRDSKHYLNFLWPDLLCTELMFKYQSHLITGQPDGAELQTIALRICHHAEAIARWPEVEVGTDIAGHNWLILTAMFLPRDNKHMQWSRRMFARIELSGYVFAPRVRRALAEFWNDPTVEEWWDPTDEEGCPNIIKEIRKLTEERTTSPRDNLREEIRDLKTLFANMQLSQGGSPDSGPST
ncbi:C6 finger domain protein, putative [Talaromyces stipitatus ATCC 10500]|uniref:C6 finger domain protein, putative n=1 Tax=Talaromyces stipitatus (strain ATCC 10500 / CBS 375.48 / QM 6759 / NRRL 1006) TaxID=441959 RepID=B8M8Q8_TALSN|nr:C6 finger domain protein, putative [Talaromyces stipitatus ATCC 10500]EED20571.1 C6 finger domain protein, putative [Talaromyces stipitatus ATCC 10500]